MGGSVQPGGRKEVLKEALETINRLKARLAEYEQAENEPIAIVGAACRFPGGVKDLDSYWSLLEQERYAVEPVGPERWKLAGVDHVEGQFHAGQLHDIDSFDAAFFGISPREALTIDPQQRLVLEVGWESLENAGIAPAKLAGSQTGVFIGVSASDYAEAVRQGHGLNDIYAATGTAHNVVAGRLSYVLGLQGPCMAVDTACSSSLVAVHLACQSLRRKESSIALAGGVNTLFDPEYFQCLNSWGMMAPDGKCKTFDRAANGFVRSDGCGIITMKRLSDAIASGDNILGVILATAINQDGRSSGLTVPNGLAQQALLRSALASGKLQPSDVQYVEAHGTGTSLGDPIEVEALATVLGRERTEEQPLYLGSAKTNLGHMEAAAGIGGLLKAMLSIRKGVIPASLHFEEWNPQIPRGNAPLHVPTSATPWPACDRRVAGVSSFGFSGTNAHVILGPPPQKERQTAGIDRPAHLLTLSGATAEAVKDLAGCYERQLTANPDTSIGDLCFSAATGRSHLLHRMTCQAASIPELIDELRRASETGQPVQAQRREPRIAFLFTGQGSHYPGMAEQLSRTQPAFRAALDLCASILGPVLDCSLESLLFGENADRMSQTRYAQPALFSLEYALCEMWRSWGVQPSFVMGHSLGEFVAACVAGILPLEPALLLVAERGRLMQQLPTGGRMAAIGAPEATVRAAIQDLKRTSVAAINGPENVVVSGDGAEVEIAVERLTQAGSRCQFLNVSHAFHSPLVVPMLNALEAAAQTIPHSASRIALVSNLTGEIAKPGTITPEYWRHHAREAVQFQRSIEALRKSGATIFLEIGPGGTLTAMARECLPQDSGTLTATLSSRKQDWSQVLSALAALYEQGVNIDWTAFDRPYIRERVPLPLNPWKPQRYWPAVGRRRRGAAAQQGSSQFSKRKLESPVVTGDVYEFEISADHVSVADHVINGEILFPLTGYLQLMHEAGISSVENVSIHQPLKVEENSSCTVQVVVENGAIDVFSRQNGEWIRHVQAVAATAGSQPLPEEDLRAVQTRLGPPQPIGDFYERMRQVGIAYGASYQRLKGFTAESSEALSQMEGGSDLAAIIDSALHVLFPLIELTGVKGLLLPVGIGRVWLSESFKGMLWTHAKLTSLTPGGMTADLEIFNGKGELVGWLKSFEARRVGRQDVSLLHQLAWSECPLTTEPRAGSGDWLVIGDDAVQAQRLADRLRAHGCDVVRTSRAESTDVIAQGRQWTAVVYLTAEDAKDGTAIEQTMEATTGFLYPLVRSLRDCGQTPQLWVVTKNGQPVEGGSADPVQASVWGAGRCLLLEYPEYRCSLIDSDSRTNDETVARELLAGGGEALIAFRRDNRYVPRLKHWRSALGDAQKLTIDAPGILDNLHSTVVERRKPGRDEVEIRVLATGLNFRDVLSALGMIPLQTPDSASFGAECAGVVERVGEDVTDIAPGDEVVAFAGSSFATHVIARSAMVARKADGLSFAQAAALPVAYMTCMYGMEMLAQMKKGDTVLVHAAAGGVGVAALELARRAGAVVLATAGSEHKRQYVRDQGVQHVFDSRSPDFAEQVLEVTNGRGVDIVVNSLAGEMIDASFRALAEGGAFIELGKRGIWTEAEVHAKRPDARYFAFDFGERAWSDPPLVRGLLNELNRRLEGGELRPLPTQVFPHERSADAFRTMAQARHIGKLAVLQSGFGVAHAARVVANGTYVITGGLGALGLQTAAWLVQQGAKSLVLVGRRLPGPDAAEAIDDLRKHGVRVEVRQADIADRLAVEELLAGIRESMGSIRGIFHAAGVVDDTIAADLTWDRAWGVMSPKIAGIQNLDQASRRDPIDYFVLFSSASAVIGSPGQSSYAAGNAYLDAIAHARRAEGLPALSVNWGGWASSGMAARLDSRQLARWERAGVTPIEPADGFRALESALNGTAPQLTAVNVDWDAFVDQAQLRRDLPFFTELPRKRSVSAGAEADLRTTLRTADAEQRAGLIKEFLRVQARQVLALPASYPFSDDQPLHELGLDSVMAVELRTRIDRGTGVSLPTVRLLDSATVSGLAPEILHKLESQRAGDEPEVRDSIEELVDAIPDEDVEAMLKQLVAGASNL